MKVRFLKTELTSKVQINLPFFFKDNNYKFFKKIFFTVFDSKIDWFIICVKRKLIPYLVSKILRGNNNT